MQRAEKERHTLERRNMIHTNWDACFADEDDEDRRCGPATGNAGLDDEVVDEDGEGVVDEDEDEEEDKDDDSTRRDGAGGGEDKGESSSARVPEPSRYSFPRHLIVDEPVNALK